MHSKIGLKRQVELGFYSFISNILLIIVFEDFFQKPETFKAFAQVLGTRSITILVYMYSNSFPSQTVSVKYDIFWARLNSCPHTNTILYLNFESFELNQGKNFFSKFYGKASIKSW